MLNPELGEGATLLNHFIANLSSIDNGKAAQ